MLYNTTAVKYEKERGIIKSSLSSLGISQLPRIVIAEVVPIDCSQHPHIKPHTSIRSKVRELIGSARRDRQSYREHIGVEARTLLLINTYQHSLLLYQVQHVLNLQVLHTRRTFGYSRVLRGYSSYSFAVSMYILLYTSTVCRLCKTYSYCILMHVKYFCYQDLFIPHFRYLHPLNLFNITNRSFDRGI